MDQTTAPLASAPRSDDRALLVRCHDCDLLQRIEPLPPEATANCPRCGATLFAHKPHGFERAFVLYLSALLLLIIANTFPFLTLKVQGQMRSSHLISGAIDLYRNGMPEIAVAVILFVVVFPLLKIVIGLAVIGASKQEPRREIKSWRSNPGGQILACSSSDGQPGSVVFDAVASAVRDRRARMVHPERDTGQE